MSTAYRLPSQLTQEATAASAADWLLIQKDGETWLRKLHPTASGLGLLPTQQEDDAAAAAAADWILLQKDGETRFLRLHPTAAAFGAMATSHAANSITALGATPAALGAAASAGTATTVARGDHVHPYPTAANVGALPSSGGTLTGDVERTNGVRLMAPGASSTDPVYSFNLDPDTGLSNHSANGLGVITQGALRVGVGNGGFFPAIKDTLYLGTADYRWAEIWCTQTDINTASDARLKTDIADSDLGLTFIQALRPVRYKWVVGDRVPQADGGYVDRAGVRPHYGLIAQEVKQAMEGLECDDFAGWVYDTDSDTYALRMAEFIAPLIKAVQELAARVEELEAQLGVGEA